MNCPAAMGHEEAPPEPRANSAVRSTKLLK